MSAPTHIIEELRTLMARLRDPETGCPWDKQQDFASIAPYTIEEAYEVADAIARGDMDDLKDELGDLLFQVIFHARMAEEKDIFDFNDVTYAIIEKMRRRHPHIFGDKHITDIQDATQNWESIKAAEKRAKGKQTDSLLADIPHNLPALSYAVKLQNRAAQIGFDWEDSSHIFSKLQEEITELQEEMPSHNPDRLEDELGDILFVVANLARHLNINPEAALRRASHKFTTRFHYMEHADPALATRDLTAMEALWQQAKRHHK